MAGNTLPSTPEMMNLIAELDDAERVARIERARQYAPPGDEDQQAYYLAGWYAGWNDALQHL